jgi:hypothetical protein
VNNAGFSGVGSIEDMFNDANEVSVPGFSVGRRTIFILPARSDARAVVPS